MTRRRARLVGVLLVAPALLLAASLAPAHAQTELTRGSAAATATVAGLNIPYSGANIGIDVGVSNSSFFEGTAKASAIALEPGALRITSIIKACDADFALPIPPATSADTNAAGGKATSAHKELGPGLGTEDASAEPGSRSQGKAVGGAFGIPGVVEVAGGEALTSTALDAGAQARTLRSEVRTGTVSLLGGLVEIEGLRWVVEQRAVGADSRTIKAQDATSFSVGSIRLGGVALPSATPADIEASLASINQVTGPMGLQLRMPRVIPNGAHDLELTPLAVALGGDTAAGPYLYPLIAGGGGTSLVDLFNSLTQPLVFDPASCNSLLGLVRLNPEANQILNTLGIYAPVILSAFAAALNGGAEMNLNVGGVRTLYDAAYYAPRTIPTFALGTTIPGPPGLPTAGSVTPGRAAVPQVGAPERISTTCRSTSPVGRPGCWKGRASLAATVAAVVVLGLFATDELGRRRRTRSTQEKP